MTFEVLSMDTAGISTLYEIYYSSCSVKTKDRINYFLESLKKKGRKLQKQHGQDIVIQESDFKVIMNVLHYRVKFVNEFIYDNTYPIFLEINFDCYNKLYEVIIRILDTSTDEESYFQYAYDLNHIEKFLFKDAAGSLDVIAGEDLAIFCNPEFMCQIFKNLFSMHNLEEFAGLQYDVDTSSSEFIKTAHEISKKLKSIETKIES